MNSTEPTTPPVPSPPESQPMGALERWRQIPARSRLLAGAVVLALVLAAFFAGTLVPSSPPPIEGAGAGVATTTPAAQEAWVVPPEEIGTVRDPGVAASVFVEKAFRDAVPVALEAQNNAVGELRRLLDGMTFGDGRFGVSENLFRTAELEDFLPPTQMDDIRSAGGYFLQFEPTQTTVREMFALQAAVEVSGELSLQFTMAQEDKEFTQDAGVVVWLVRESTTERWTVDAVQVLER